MRHALIALPLTVMGMTGCTTNATSAAVADSSAAGSSQPVTGTGAAAPARSPAPPLGRYVVAGTGEPDTWIEIDDGRIGAKAGCNALGADYAIAEDGTWTVGPVRRSKMYCEGRMQAEDGLIAKLAAIHRVVRDGDAVALLDAGGTTLLTLRPAQ